MSTWQRPSDGTGRRSAVGVESRVERPSFGRSSATFCAREADSHWMPFPPSPAFHTAASLGEWTRDRKGESCRTRREPGVSFTQLGPLIVRGRCFDVLPVRGGVPFIPSRHTVLIIHWGHASMHQGPSTRSEGGGRGLQPAFGKAAPQGAAPPIDATRVRGPPGSWGGGGGRPPFPALRVVLLSPGYPSPTICALRAWTHSPVIQIVSHREQAH